MGRARLELPCVCRPGRAFNEVYKKYFEQGRFPARHAFGVTGLYLDARVEVSCVAVVK